MDGGRAVTGSRGLGRERQSCLPPPPCDSPPLADPPSHARPVPGPWGLGGARGQQAAQEKPKRRRRPDPQALKPSPW